MSDLWPWLALLGLGAYHGINPAMGWLFAVALGLQEKSRRAVLGAMPPIALGHALSIAVVVGLLWLAQASVPEKPLRYAAAAILFGFGLFRLVRSRHPKWVGMRVGFRDLTLWSFLMASAHGAGLMLVPIMLGWPQEHAGHMSHSGVISSHQMTALSGPLQWVSAVLVHSAGYLSVALLIALVVYEKLGLALLRRAWFNLDLLWMIALMMSGVLILIL
jgi:hypothetical protein